MTVPVKTISLPTPAAGLFALSDWELIRVTGSERVDFLKGLLTNTIRKLTIGEGNLTLYLTAKGRIQGEALLSYQEDSILLLSPAGCGQKLHDFLEHYHVIEDVEVAQSNAYLPFLCTGYALSQALESLGLAMPAMGKGIRFNSLAPAAKSDIWATRYPLLQPLETLVVWSPVEYTPALIDHLQRQGIPLLLPEQFQGLQTAYQWYDVGQELDGLLVHEAGLETTHVDFTKGCFVGQEVVARTQHRGQANKHLYSLHTPGTVQIPPSTPVLDETGKEVGQILSRWQLDPDTRIYRALLKRKAVEEATQLQAVAESGTVSLELVAYQPPQ